MTIKKTSKTYVLAQLNEIKNRLTDTERSDGTLTLVNQLIADVTNDPDDTDYSK